MGRPREHDRDSLLISFRNYILTNDIPIVAEFAYQNEVDRQRLYEWDEFADALKDCIAKKESALERGALSGKLQQAMAIFSLKQLGWTDKIDQTLKGDKEAPIMITATDSRL